MGTRYGADAFVGVAKEITWASAVAPVDFCEINNESGGLNPGRTEIPTWRARVVPAFMDIGAKTGKGYSFPMTYESLLYFLRGTFQTYAMTVVAPGPPAANQHEFKSPSGLTTVKSPSLTIVGANTEAGSNTYQYAGCYIRRLTLEFVAADLAKLSVEFVGIPEILIVKPAAPTFAATSLYVRPGQYTITIDSEFGKSLELDNFTVVIETGMDEGRVKLRSTTAIVEPEIIDRFKITGSFARDWSVASTYAKFVAGTAAAVTIKAATPGFITATTPWSFEVFIPQAIYIGNSPVHTGPGLVQESMNFQAQDDASNTACRVRVVNTEASVA